MFETGLKGQYCVDEERPRPVSGLRTGRMTVGMLDLLFRKELVWESSENHVQTPGFTITWSEVQVN